MSAVYAVPVLGWLLKDAVEGLPDAKYWFLGNLVALSILAVWFFGYPAILTIGLIGTAGMLTSLVVLTSFDIIEGALRRK